MGNFFLKILNLHRGVDSWIKKKYGDLHSIGVLNICFKRFKRVLERFSHGRYFPGKKIPVHQTEKQKKNSLKKPQSLNLYPKPETSSDRHCTVRSNSLNKRRGWFLNSLSSNMDYEFMILSPVKTLPLPVQWPIIIRHVVLWGEMKIWSGLVS